MTPTTMLDAALEYRSLGYPVFPCEHDKAPLVKSGFRAATLDEATIRGWWTKWPYALLAIPTGHITDLVLCDIDRKNGKDGYIAIKRLGLDLSKAPLAVTPSGGNHALFRAGGLRLKSNSNGKVGDGVDIKADGGYWIAPPSNPNPAKPGYSWVREIPLSAAPLVPDKIVQLLSEKTDELTQECNKVRSAEPGSRNAVLNAAAFRIAKIVLGGRLREERAREELTLAAREVGLGDDEILKTLNSAFSAREREKESKSSAKQGRKLVFAEIEPWDEEVDGADLINELTTSIHRHVIVTAEQALAIALWVIHAYCLDAADHSPRLHLWGPTKRCGKTTLLLVIRCLVPRPISTETLTVPVLFRLIDAYRPTVLIDEVDVLLKDNDELRAAINAGFEPHGMAYRIVGEDLEPRGFSMFAATLLSGIGHLHGTLADRSIEIGMCRRLKSEQITRLDAGAKSDLFSIAQKIARWSKDHLAELKAARPVMPASINDRAVDCWRPLIAIAGAIGEDIRKLAWAAALAVTVEDNDTEAGVTLLGDIKEIFADQAERNIADPDKLSSSALVLKLINLESRPWAAWGKARKPVSQISVSRLLKPYRITPDTIRFSDGSLLKGYKKEDFCDAWERYL